jgi:hypothetical protein
LQKNLTESADFDSLWEEAATLLARLVVAASLAWQRPSKWGAAREGKSMAEAGQAERLAVMAPLPPSLQS